MHGYNDTFFDYLNEGSARSAAAVVPLLRSVLRLRSVLDVGCGQGAWLQVWHAHGVTDISGLDGAYVDRNRLLVPQHCFATSDLARPFDLGRRFDIVQSLEVAEHLPADSAGDFVRSLTAHSSIVLFSAATPGQGGEQHVNEQWPEYWRRLFAQRGYAMADFIRPRVARNPNVEPWYRYNTFLYVAEDEVIHVPPAIREAVIPANEAVPSMAPRAYRIRSAIFASLPHSVVTKFARFKHRAIVARRRQHIR